MASPDNSIKNNGAHITKFKTGLTNQEISQLSVIDGSYYNPQSLTYAIDFSLREQNSTSKNQRQIAATLGASLLNAGVTIKNASALMVEGLTDTEKFAKKKQNVVEKFNYGKPKPRKGDNPYLKMKRTKEEIVGISDLGYAGTEFPIGLSENAPSYLELQFYKYKRQNPMVEASLGEPIRIQLPMPQNFMQSYSIRLDQRDTGFYGDVVNQSGNATAGIQNALKTGTMPSGQRQQFLNNAGDMIKNAGLRGMMMGIDGLDFGISDLAGADSKSASGLLTQFMGSVPNPHASVFFKGMDLRQWSWVWKFVPRSSDETQRLREILKIIKEAVLPWSVGSLLRYPNMIKPVIIGDQLNVMGTFGLTMVKNLMINFTPEGGSAFFYDGAPVAIEVTMEFQEITIQTGGNVPPEQFTEIEKNLQSDVENNPNADSGGSGSDSGGT